MQIETLNPIKIKVSGSERFDFLQNIITNDLNKLEEELFSYILTPQGSCTSRLIALALIVSLMYSISIPGSHTMA